MRRGETLVAGGGSVPVIPKVAALHDLSGFGRTSLTVVIPVLSAMGVQVCPVPTAVLSTHTVEFTDYYLLDMTDALPAVLDHWIRLHLRFDAVYSGFMSCPAQMEHVERCIRSCLAPRGLALVDPVLGDGGVLDPTMTPEMVAGMRRLIARADIITPNYTEAAFLLGESYTPRCTPAKSGDWLARLRAMGPKTVVITSVPLDENAGGGGRISAVAVDSDGRMWRVDSDYVPAHYPGTGDTFASVLLGGLLRGDALSRALDLAGRFVAEGIALTFKAGTPTREGIFLESILGRLREPLPRCGCSGLEW
jgi:pyridoxine kinase